MAGPSKTDRNRSALPPDQAAVADEVVEIDADIAALRARFDQYFIGLERHSPIKDCEALRKRLVKLKGQFIRNTGLKFRVQSLYSKFQSYERLWLKTLKEMEEGTYKRDLFRLRRKKQATGPTEKKPESDRAEEKPRPDFYSLDEDLEADLPDDLFEDFVAPKPAAVRAPVPVAKSPPPAPAVAAAPPTRGPPPPPAAKAPPPAPVAAKGPPPAPVAARVPPPAPVAARGPPPAPGAAARPAAPPPAPRPAPAAAAAARPAPLAADGLSGDKVKQIYDAYLTAKKRCKESTAGITPEAVASSLRKQVPQIMKESGARSVDFKVVIKDGKAILKAVPKP